MRRNTIALVWLGGIVLAAVLYVAGPAFFVGTVLVAVNEVGRVVADSITFLSVQSFELVRAVAIALFAVFLVLGAIAGQRRIRGAGMVGVTVLFVGLLTLGGYESRFCWLAALVVAGAGALHMTQRLLGRPASGAWGDGSLRGPFGSRSSRP